MNSHVFCSGNDLKDFLDNPPHSDASPVFQFLQAISRAAKSLLAAVGGPAAGIGTTMLLHCDLVYATAEAHFQLPFISLGLVPEAASSLLLPMIAGHQRAAELLLLGKPFDSAKALAVQEQMREEGVLFRELLGSPEAKEAMNAFLEKRKPDFSKF